MCSDLDKASAFRLSLPGRCLTVKSYPANSSVHLASIPVHCLSDLSCTRALLSVLMIKGLKDKIGANFLIPLTIALNSPFQEG